MDHLERIRAIEVAAYRSWQARECVEYDGWQLRYADGFSRRGNSVYPAGASSLELGEKLEWCRHWYRQRNLDLVVRQTIATEPGIDEALEARGFRLEGKTDVMTMSLHQQAGDLEIQAGPSPIWWQTASALWGFDADRPDGWSAIINRIDLPAGFVSLADRAAGLAILDGRWLGLFEIVVAPSHRRQGLGRAVTQSLLAWGESRGARHAYLQVVADNTAAISLYGRMGFVPEYSYWYRRGQEPAAKRPA